MRCAEIAAHLWCTTGAPTATSKQGMLAPRDHDGLQSTR
jgi:hypothetical protein